MFNLYDKLFGRYEDDYEDVDDLEEIQDVEASYEDDPVEMPEKPSRNFLDRFSGKSRQRPERKPQARVLDMNSGTEIDYNQEVVVMIPYDFDMTKMVCDYVKQGKTVICNIEKIDNETAQRVLDFILGATYALGGSLESISNKIFVVTPASTRLNMRMEESRDRHSSSRQRYSGLRNTGARRERRSDSLSRDSYGSRFDTYPGPGRKAVNL